METGGSNHGRGAWLGTLLEGDAAQPLLNIQRD